MSDQWDPFTSPLIQDKWRKKIRLRNPPNGSRVIGKCAVWHGWTNGKDSPSGVIRVKNKRWYLHRYIHAKFHGITLKPGEPIRHLCHDDSCFNPMHTVRRS